MYNEGKYDSIDVAKYIAAYWNEKYADINVTQIQKLLYIAYGIWLVAGFGGRLTNEHPKVWPYGPVFPRTRNYFVKHAPDAATESDVSEELRHDDDFNSILDLLFNNFGEWTASRLTRWSHQKGSPWDKARIRYNEEWGREIDDNDIKEYFGTMYRVV
jgi:uncharacterized phage-associated protein